MFPASSSFLRILLCGISLTLVSGCGGGSSAPEQSPSHPTTVVGSSVSTVANIEKSTGWNSCDVCAGAHGKGPTVLHGMVQNVAVPSRDGSSTQFWIDGGLPYSNALWWKNIVNADQTPVNQATHHFVLDLYFYLDNPEASEGLEWDVNQFVDGRSYIFGSQCSYRGAGTWDVWDNVNSHWVSTGFSCPTPDANTWNHVVLEFERTGNNQIHYIAMTMNGERHDLDWFYDSTVTEWNGIDVNFQMDGNFRQERYSAWVDGMTLTYW